MLTWAWTCWNYRFMYFRLIYMKILVVWLIFKAVRLAIPNVLKLFLKNFLLWISFSFKYLQSLAYVLFADIYANIIINSSMSAVFGINCIKLIQKIKFFAPYLIKLLIFIEIDFLTCRLIHLLNFIPDNTWISIRLNRISIHKICLAL